MFESILPLNCFFFLESFPSVTFILFVKCFSFNSSISFFILLNFQSLFLKVLSIVDSRPKKSLSITIHVLQFY